MKKWSILFSLLTGIIIGISSVWLYTSYLSKPPSDTIDAIDKHDYSEKNEDEKPSVPTIDPIQSNTSIIPETEQGEIITNDYSINELLLPSDVEFITVSENVEGKNEKVILLKDPPAIEEDTLRKIYILRVVNQVLRDDPTTNKITLWDEEDLAQQYASGNYEKDKSYTGWEGLDARVALMSRDEYGVRVFYAISRDDFEDISFGMSLVVD